MKEEEIIKRHKLIADSPFSGLKWKGTKGKWYKGLIGYKVDQLKYNTSWEWLMPVLNNIEFFEGDGYSTTLQMSTTECTIKINSLGYDHPVEEIYYDDAKEMKAAWLAVCAFMKWYNDRN